MRVLNRWGPAILLLIIIFYLSALPGEVVDSAGLGKESYHINGHLVLYFLLTWALYRATKKVHIAMILAMVYAFTDEYHQTFVAGRSGGKFDLYVDAIGIFISGLILWKFYRHLPKRLQTWLEV